MNAMLPFRISYVLSIHVCTMYNALSLHFMKRQNSDELNRVSFSKKCVLVLNHLSVVAMCLL